MAASARILYCHCAYARIVPAETKTEVLARLAYATALPIADADDLTPGDPLDL